MLKVSAYQQLNLPEKISSNPVNRSNNKAAVKKSGVEFKNALNQALTSDASVKFSAHARARLHSRGVELTDDKVQAISDAIDKAEAKGARESLILADEAAYVVSVKNRTVITAFDRDNLRDGVFTAIDSAVIL